MNSRQTYLAWVRTTQPKLYYAALQQVFGKANGAMGGLGDDLTDSILSSENSPDLISVADFSDPGVSSDVTAAVNNAYTASVSPSSTTQGGGTDFFSSLASAISSIAPTVVQTQAAENLLQINTRNAAAGLPLYTSNGQIVTGSMLSPTSASVAAMEAALSGTGSLLPLLLIGGVAMLMLVGTRHS